MTTQLVVVGGGGFGREVLDVVAEINAAGSGPFWDVLGVADDALSSENHARLAARGVPWLGSVASVVTRLRARYVVGVGSPTARAELAARFETQGWLAATLVDPDATVGSQVTLGSGTVVCAGARIGTNVIVGRHGHINANATVGHDALLGDFVSVNPLAAISGDCTVGSGTLVGAGAVVRQGQVVGDHAVIGASACVIDDVGPGSTFVGVPAQPVGPSGAPRPLEPTSVAERIATLDCRSGVVS